MASRYQRVQLPALSPATSKTARRCGSKMNRIRISVFPADPGRSSLRLRSLEPVIRFHRGAAERGAAPGGLDRVPYQAGADVGQRHEPVVDIGDQDDLPAHPTIITCGLSPVGTYPFVSISSPPPPRWATPRPTASPGRGLPAPQKPHAPPPTRRRGLRRVHHVAPGRGRHSPAGKPRRRGRAASEPVLSGYGTT